MLNTKMALACSHEADYAQHQADLHAHTWLINLRWTWEEKANRGGCGRGKRTNVGGESDNNFLGVGVGGESKQRWRGG